MVNPLKQFGVAENKEPLPALYDEEGYPVIQFRPVPQLRHRRIGWDAERQRAFIGMLARVPSVTRAARAVGMSARSAYKLLDKPEAQEFARAWDQALDYGLNRLRGHSLARTLEGGDYVPVYRKGRLVRIDFRPNDKLALALLAGKDHDIHFRRRGAQARWRQTREWEKIDAARAKEIEAGALAREDYARQLEEFLSNNPPPPRIPRIRML